MQNASSLVGLSVCVCVCVFGRYLLLFLLPGRQLGRQVISERKKEKKKEAKQPTSILNEFARGRKTLPLPHPLANNRNNLPNLEDHRLGRQAEFSFFIPSFSIVSLLS